MNLKPIHKTLLEGGILILLVFLAFGPSLANDYIWDDPEYVYNNPVLPRADGLNKIWFDVQSTPQYYPLVHTTFWLEYRLWGTVEHAEYGPNAPNPFGFHLDNLLLHAAGALLLWRVLRRLSVPGAYFAASLFAVHPILVESVAWVTERKNVLSGALMLAAALSYLRFAGIRGPREEPQEQRGSLGWYVMAFVFFSFALLSKTVVAFMPGALFLALWWRRGKIDHREWLPLALLLIPALIAGLHTAYLERERVGASGAAWDHTFIERTLVAGRVPWFYVSKIFAPFNLHFIYPRWDIDTGVWWQYLFPLATIGLVAALWLLRKKIGLGPFVVALIYGGGLLPASGYFNVYPMQFSWVADHFQYHASMAVFALIGALIAVSPLFKNSEARPIDGPLKERLPIAGTVSVGVLVVALAVLSGVQCGLYKNEEHLWTESLERNPEIWLAHGRLAELEWRRGRLDLAEHHYQEVMRLQGAYIGTMYDYAILALTMRDLPKAAELSRRAYSLDPNDWRSQALKAKISMNQNNYEEARDLLMQALAQVGPKGIGRQEDMYADLGIAFLYLEDYPAAMTNLQIALQIIPQVNRGFEILPRIYRHLGQAQIKAGQVNNGIGSLQQALSVGPSNVSAMVTLAWVFASHPQAKWRNGQEALRFAEAAYQLTQGNDPRIWDILAAANAEAGNFDKALNAAQNAARMYGRRNQKKKEREALERVQVYERGEKFRQPNGLP